MTTRNPREPSFETWVALDARARGGPPTTQALLDPEALVEAWRQARDEGPARGTREEEA